MITNKSIYVMVLSVFAMTSCNGGNGEQKIDVPQEYPLLIVKPEERNLAVKYTAVLEGRQDVEIRPEVSGLITEVCIDEGARVRKGQVLFIIDQVPYRAALQKSQAAVATAEASLANAKLSLEGKEELFKEKIISDFELRTAQNTYKSAEAALLHAKAELREAENNLSYTEVKSPVDGIAGMTSYRIGSLVGPTIATPLINVSDNSRMYAYFSMSEKQALELTTKYGSMEDALKSYPPISLELKDGNVYSHKGQIDVISGMVDKSTGTVSLRANFPNESRQLLSGGSANVILSYNRPESLVIPQGATYELQNRIFSYKVVNGSAVSTPIEVFKINDGKEYIVVSGIAEGDTIVAKGAGLLKAGTKITAMKERTKTQEDAK
ncbi:efflux RND transporter periplasmic adaptor subunit [uncultured Muribaculum sp.]|uniref:efflux RND transporter periplasmic adaptor subunit n=1 Tax=uncultured Muribaculum sp. TaxID=1918613 RepID=UPI002595FC85|nr:efflux RND transporter periplasmic adaptor subunit [uncultured Muribaculum sp.]